MKSVLITGVSGFIGKALAKSLKAKYAIYGISRTNPSNSADIEIIDLSQKEAGVEFLKEKKFDVIIHLASNLASASNLRSLEVLDQNMQMCYNLIEGIKNYRNCYLINFSSSAVYPNLSGLYSENDEVNPSVNNDCLYGLSKFNNEMLFQFLLPKQIKQLHLRVGLVYGEEMDPSRIHFKFAEELRQYNQITVWGNGERTLPQIEVNSLAEKILLFIDREIEGTVNIADENISLSSLAKRVIQQSGNKQSKIVYNVEGNKNKFKLNISRLKSITDD